MATCSKCGATVADQKAFCQDCGAPTSPQAQTNAPPPQPGLGATVIVPPSEWPSMPTTPPPGAARPPQPAPQSAAAAPQTARTPVAPAPTPVQTAPPVVPAPTPEKGRGALVYVLVGAIALLLIILALVLLNN